MTLDNVPPDVEAEFLAKPPTFSQLDPLFSSARTGDQSKDLWETPAWLFDLLNDEFQFTIDAAASPHNAKVAPYWTEEDDGLAQDWKGTIWVNPPYSKSALWLAKGYQAAMQGQATSVLLVGARPDTQYWWNYVRFGEVRFLPGRLRFIGAASGGAPFPSAVVIFHRDMARRTPTTLYWDVRDPERKHRAKQAK